MSTPILSICGLSKTYKTTAGDLRALSNFDLELGEGEVIGLLGPNGSGKSTLVKMLLALVEKSDGQIKVFGEERKSSHYLKHIGAMIEGKCAVNERLTAYENAKYYCRLREAKFDQALFEQMSHRLSLSDIHSPCRYLSTGNKQKVALICCLIHRPKLVILDEPTLGLDVFGINALQTLMTELQQDYRVSFIVSSHDFDFIYKTCQRLTVIDKGITIFNGPIAEIERMSYAYKVTLPPLDYSQHGEVLQEIRYETHRDSTVFFINTVIQLQRLLDLVRTKKLESEFKLEAFELRNQYLGLFN